MARGNKGDGNHFLTVGGNKGVRTIYSIQQRRREFYLITHMPRQTIAISLFAPFIRVNEHVSSVQSTLGAAKTGVLYSAHQSVSVRLVSGP